MESYNNLKLLTVKINRAGIALLLTSVFLIYSDLWHSPSTSAETEEKSILFQNLTISLKIPKDEELSPAEILRKVDDNMLYSTAKAEVEMIISFGKREFKKRMVSFSKGRDTSFVKFLYPSRDAGIKFLKMKDNMWMYLPSVDKIIRISGHMKRQSMMGSDFSYEDVMETSSLLEDYQVVLERKEKLKGNENYVLSLMAKRHNVTYVRRKLWVDAEKFIVNKMELYSKSGKLLKIYTADETGEFQGRFFPVRTTMRDMLRKSSKTEFIVKEITFDVDLPEEIFTKRALRRR